MRARLPLEDMPGQEPQTAAAGSPSSTTALSSESRFGMKVIRLGEQVPLSSLVTATCLSLDDYWKTEDMSDLVLVNELAACKHVHVYLSDSERAVLRIFKHDLGTPEYEELRQRRAAVFASVAKALREIQRIAITHGQGKRLLMTFAKNPSRINFYVDNNPVDRRVLELFSHYGGA